MLHTGIRTARIILFMDNLRNAGENGGAAAVQDAISANFSGIFAHFQQQYDSFAILKKILVLFYLKGLQGSE